MKTSSLFRAGVASLTLAAVSISAHAQQSPKPTPEMQAIIDKDNGRHFGTSPEVAGPLAKDISPALTPAAIDKVMRKVADWQLNESQPYFDKIWTWSVLYSGFMAASDSLGDPKYRNVMAEMSEKFEYQPRNPDKLPNADDISIAQTYAELYLAGGKKDAKIITPTIHTLDTVMPLETLRPGDPRIPWWWCDALFMAPAVYTRMYAATGDHKYIDYMNAQWQRTYDLLWDKDEHLYARDASYIPKRGPNGKKIFWSRGEGWVMAGLARTLQFLPKDDPRRPFYVQQLKDMAERVAQLQDKDGQWHASLLDAEHFPAAETSGASLFVYGMAYGVNEGILDKTKYMPVIKKAWAGLLTNLYADGRLGNIQQTGAEPAYYRPSASYTYGVGGFLMAGSELKRMAKKK
ncbi:MAG: glycoside hydrolase family 88 protein [Acidobacteria bacterium]|nr:glycoside hydrolase family 88 protein [Acidobacteriota bacterium]